VFDGLGEAIGARQLEEHVLHDVFRIGQIPHASAHEGAQRRRGLGHRPGKRRAGLLRQGGKHFIHIDLRRLGPVDIGRQRRKSTIPDPHHPRPAFPATKRASRVGGFDVDMRGAVHEDPARRQIDRRVRLRLGTVAFGVSAACPTSF
jgi:hypothetical protein